MEDKNGLELRLGDVVDFEDGRANFVQGLAFVCQISESPASDVLISDRIKGLDHQIFGWMRWTSAKNLTIVARGAKPVEVL